MEQNFAILDGVVVKVGDILCDVHNTFDFLSFRFNLQDYLAELEFKANAYAVSSAPRALTIRFLGVDWFETSPYRPTSLPGEGQYVDEIGYKAPDDRDHDWLGNKRTSPDDHLFIRLGGDAFIRIHARKAEAHFVP